MEIYLIMTGIGFLAGGLQGLTGFGTVMVALPLLSMVVDIKTAVPLIALLGLFINGLQAAQLRKQADWRPLVPVLLGSLLGIPAGARLLKIVPSAWLQAFFGLILLGFVAFSLTAAPEKRPLKTRWAWLAGILSGVLGGSIGANGPPVIVYATLGPWNKVQIKAMLVSYLAANFVLLCAYYGFTGVFTLRIATFFGATMPGTVLGILAGTMVSARVGEGQFRLLVLLVLLVLGATLISKSLGAA
ncbi:MAG: sulfite exporter TauE/SafE family protein [Desulfovibrionaceae bacterium]|jgi:uncharacterized membrane protein YfcA|nr:sulfite exporter TauE/SafE family protein [Desulfovibrionaceae bacterium]